MSNININVCLDRLSYYKIMVHVHLSSPNRGLSVSIRLCDGDGTNDNPVLNEDDELKKKDGMNMTYRRGVAITFTHSLIASGKK